MLIRLLGPVDALGKDGPIDLGGRKQRTLAALLAANSGIAVSVDRCIDALWGESAPSGARHSLQTYVSNLRRTLDPARGGLLESTGDGYRLLVETDMSMFESVITDSESSLDDLAGALALWRGRPFGDLGDDEWARGLVTRMDQLYLRGVDDLARARLAAGDAETVVLGMEKAISEHPFQEAFWAHYMTALYQTGRQTEALRAFAELKEKLGGELGIEPTSDLAALEEQILLHDPVLERPDTTDNNLPSDTSSLVGREKDVGEVVDLLSSSRLVTLIGSGGVGKTRLGIAVGRAALGSFPDGVWFVDLAQLESGSLVLPAVAGVLGVEPPALRPLEDALAEHVGDTRVLFILDNCEHLIEDVAAAMVSLLSRCPNARVLATSRSVLRITGETAWRVPSLDVPEPDSGFEVIERAEAVDLFVQRARSADPGFRLDADEAETVASVCRRLDGIPLAIELAAARTRTLSVVELDRHLTGAFDVLTGGGRDVLPRHRTLRATIEWSHQHLDEPERLFFEECGVFVGTFTVEAVSAVSGTSGEPTISLIDALVAQSMLQPRPGNPRRFRMLETLRTFAIERLKESGRLEELRTRHLEWALGFSLTETPKLMDDRQVEAVEQLRLALDDFRSAMEWSLTSGRPDQGLRMAASLARFWYLAAMHFEGADWLERLFEADPDVNDVQMARAKTAFATTLVRIGRWDEAAQMTRDAVALLEPLDEPVALGWAYYYLAIALVSGAYDNAPEIISLWEKALNHFTAGGFKPGIALTTMLLGAGTATRDPEAGIAMLTPVIEAAGPAGNSTLVGHALELRATARIRSGLPLHESSDDLIGSIQAHHSTGNWACLAHAFEGVAAWLVAGGREDEAASVVGAIDSLRLNLSTIQAPYERFLVGFYDWEDAIDDDPLLHEAKERGRSWDREQLMTCALDLLSSN